MSSNHLSGASPPPGPVGLTLLPAVSGGTVVVGELQPVFAAIERIVQAWVPLFRPQALAGRVVFTIQPGRGGSLGWFYADRWQRKDSGDCLPEINLCADQLAAGLHVVANVVVHELVHFADWLADIRDCSASQYHKRSFKGRAESVGLECGPWSKSKGWGFTALSADARRRVDALGIDPGVFALCRPRGRGRSGAARVPKLLRWDCQRKTPQCRPAWVAAGSEFFARCGACDTQFGRR